MTTSIDAELVVATVDCHPEHVALVGGKAVGLGRLLRAGQRVPDSFVVTAAAYRQFASRAAGDPDAALPPAVEDAIRDAYAHLGGGREVAVAVRSSATIEDAADASCAGQFCTYLGVSGADEVVAQVRRCFLSALAPHVEAYRSTRGIVTDEDAVAVVVQAMVDARAAGVLFTRHPRTGDRSLVVIEASHGLGEAVVGGEVTPDLFEVNKVTGAVSRNLGTKATEHRLTADRRGVEVRPVEPERQAAWSIDDDEVRALVATGAELERAIGRGLDVEWAIGTVDGDPGAQLFTLQVRPITVAPGAGARPDPTVIAKSPIDAVLGRLAAAPPEPGGRP